MSRRKEATYDDTPALFSTGKIEGNRSNYPITSRIGGKMI
jgi:hypothetical protein